MYQEQVDLEPKVLWCETNGKTMALWKTQDPYHGHESEPFKRNQLNTAGSVVKQRRGGTTSIATTRSVERTKIVESSTSTFDNRLFKFSPSTKDLSSSPLSSIHHPSLITYHIRKSNSTPKIRFKHREPLCAKATATSMLSAAISNGTRPPKNAETSHTAKILALVILQPLGT